MTDTFEFIYVLEVCHGDTWSRKAQTYGCKPDQFSAMLTAINLTPGQRIKRVIPPPIGSTPMFRYNASTKSVLPT